MGQPWIRIRDLHRHYRRGEHLIRALDGIDLDIARGEFVGVVGASGSGKSTLLNLLAGMDTPTSGEITVNGSSLGRLSRRELARYRALQVSLVFQSFNLVGHLSARQNVELGLYFHDVSPAERTSRATGMLDRLGLGDRLDHRPADLSGGEQQRVALARALVREPDLLLADEPTGNLDWETTRDISALLDELHREGLTIVLVTHDLELAKRSAQRTVRLRYGKVENGSAALAGEAMS